MKIDRCVCNDVTFAEVLEFSNQSGLSELDEIKDHISVCNCCMMCEPYLRQTLETGATVFGEILKRDK